MMDKEFLVVIENCSMLALIKSSKSEMTGATSRIWIEKQIDEAECYADVLVQPCVYACVVDVQLQ